MTEVYPWVNYQKVPHSNIVLVLGTTLLVEPDFDEVPEVDELCEYCGSSGGFPTVLGITTVILCSDCQVFRTDEIAYDIASI